MHYSRNLQGGEFSSYDEGNKYENASDKNDETYHSNVFFLLSYAIFSLSCVILAALAAGLTMGLLSLDPLSLEIKRRASVCSQERRWCQQLIPLLVGHSKRHRLLVSLLLLNSFANEALPLFLDELFPSKYASILVSVTLVLFFGEIVPSAFFTGPNQVKVAAKLVPVVKFVMFVLAPLAVPIAKLLDQVMLEVDDYGSSNQSDFASEVVDVTGGNYYNRRELGALLRIQYEAQLADKRRRKHDNQTLLLPKSRSETVREGGRSGLTHGVGGGAQAPSLETMSSHHSVTSNRSGYSTAQNIHHTHFSIRSIERALTSSSSFYRPNRSGKNEGQKSDNHISTHTSITGDGILPKRMPSIHADEITMIEGALSMTTKVAADVCTPLRRVYALPSDTVLDEEKSIEIWARGFSRVPVYGPKTTTSTEASAVTDVSSIIGVLLVRQLIVINPAENRPLSTIPLFIPPCVPPSMHLVDLINMFQAGGGRGRGGLHLALVCARPQIATLALEKGESVPNEAGVVGIVTLEDVVEELLQEEIYDEYDRDLELAR